MKATESASICAAPEASGPLPWAKTDEEARTPIKSKQGSWNRSFMSWEEAEMIDRTIGVNARQADGHIWQPPVPL